jgi:hypothetical protein
MHVTGVMVELVCHFIVLTFLVRDFSKKDAETATV